MSVTAKLRDGTEIPVSQLYIDDMEARYPIRSYVKEEPPFSNSFMSWCLNGRYSDEDDEYNLREDIVNIDEVLPSLLKPQEPTPAFKCEPKIGDVTVLTKTPDRPITKAQLCTEMFWHIRKNFRSQKDAAVHYGCTDSFVSAVTNGIKPPNKQMLEELGYRKIILYEKV